MFAIYYSLRDSKFITCYYLLLMKWLAHGRLEAGTGVVVLVLPRVLLGWRGSRLRLALVLVLPRVLLGWRAAPLLGVVALGLVGAARVLAGRV